MYLSMSKPTESKSQSAESAESAESIEIRTVEGMTDYFESVRLRLEKIVRFRMDPIFRARMDVSDVLQEGYIEALRRFDHWPQDGSISLFIWLRQRVLQALWDEARRGLYAALEKMSEIDREVLALRHFEYLTNQEAAQALNLTPTAASNRYVRATMRLAQILQTDNPSTQDPAQEGA